MAELNVYNHDVAVAGYSGGTPPPPYTSGTNYQQVEPYNMIVQPTVVPTEVPVVLDPGLGPNPARVTCKACNTKVVTKVKSKHSLCTHCLAAILCFGGFCICAWMPYAGEKNGDHYCPNCNAFIGTYREKQST